MFSKKSKIAFIGAGKAAYSIADALLKTGYKIDFIFSKNLISAKNFSKKFKIKTYANYNSDLIDYAEIIFLSVPDNQIKITANEISKLKLNFSHKLFIHLSGANDIFVLSSLKKKKAKTASFHIMQTFPSRKIVPVKNCYAAIETEDKTAEKYLFEVSRDLNLHPFKIKSGEKAYYHLAGVYASNFLVGNTFSAENIFKSNSKEEIKFFEIAQPIIKSTLNNISKNNSANSLSGPADRGDYKTILKHISALKKRKALIEDNINLQLLNYISQSLILLQAAEKKYGELNEGHLKIKELLIEELKKMIKK